jgi:signal peptidase II
LVENSGISYGFFQSGGAWSRWALAAFSLVVTIGLAIWAQSADKVVIAAAIGLIMGGALGNMIDRVARGSVVDFIDVQALHFPWVFNVADSAITVGIIVLLAEGLFAPKTRHA